MSAGGSFNKSENKSEFSQDIPWWQASAQRDLQNEAESWYDRQGDDSRDMMDAYYKSTQQGLDSSAIQNAQGQGQAGMNAINNQLQGGAFQGAGTVYDDMPLARGLTNSLTSSLTNPSQMQGLNNMIMGGEGNNYADAMKNTYMDDANRAQQMMMGNMDARAAASGMSGGSAHGNAIGLGNYDINKNLQSNLARTGFDTFDKDLDRKLNIAQQADQGTLQRQQMISGMLGQQQQAQNANNAGMQQSTQSAMNPMMSNQYSGMGSNMSSGLAPNMLSGSQAQLNSLNNYSNLIGRNDILSSGSSSGSGIGMSQQAGVK